MSKDTKAIAAFLAAFLIAVVALFIVSNNVSAADENVQPNYQPNTSVQNVWENYVAYNEYNEGLTEDYLDAQDFDLAVDINGEQVSAALNFLAHLESDVPSGKCAFDFWNMSHDIVSSEVAYFAGWYFTHTARVGNAVENEANYDTLMFDYEYYSNTDFWTTQKCLNKVDV